MVKASDNPYPSALFEEVASDGSATGTPSADYRRLFVGEDGLLHLKDSAGVVTDIGNLTNPMTTQGDIIYGGASGVATRLAAGTSGHFLKTQGAGSAPVWAAVAAPTFVGCKVYATATQAVNSTSAALTFASEEYDTSGFHDTGSNTSRITIPSGKDGYYLLQGGSFASNRWSWAGFKKTVSGPTTTTLRGFGSSLDVAGGSYGSVAAIVYLAATDYVEFWVNTNASCNLGHATLPDAQSWFAATLLGV